MGTDKSTPVSPHTIWLAHHNCDAKEAQWPCETTPAQCHLDSFQLALVATGS